jgi:hypothetical protein
MVLLLVLLSVVPLNASEGFLFNILISFRCFRVPLQLVVTSIMLNVLPSYSSLKMKPNQLSIHLR